MNDLKIKTIDAIRKIKEILKYIIPIKKNGSYVIPNNDTIKSFIEGEELLFVPNTKYFNNVYELKKALGV